MNDWPSYYRYWGKADRENPNRYHLLVYHCLDVAAVGTLLLEKHSLLRSRFARALGMGGGSVVRMCIFFMTIHDIGKFAEVFQNKRPDLRECLYGSENGRQSTIRHDNLGYVVWKGLWEDFGTKRAFGFNTDHPLYEELEHAFRRLACCATGHHGYPASSNKDRYELSAEHYFSSRDMETVFDFCEKQWQMHVGYESCVIDPLIDEDRVARFSWWLAGLLVVCDWIGSDDDIFGYIQEPMSLQTYWETIALPSARKALAKCGLLPSTPSLPLNLLELSGENLKPTPLQELCINSDGLDEPQLWILEDITGAGKTEAAMLLVNRMMAAGQADGFYIGLPTMATADGMYRRMAGCYHRLFKNGQSPSLILAHGSRHLSDEFRESIVPISTKQADYSVDDIPGAAQCIAWLADNRKKGLLANVGVGTVDQALLSILPSRHQSLRLFGLGSKILLVDEVHAYDAYVNQLLKRLLTFQAHIGGSVILLSATLPQKLRIELAKAYQEGLGDGENPMAETNDYPLVTTVKQGRQATTPVQASQRSIRRLPVRLIHDPASVIRELISKSENRQCACWIRNTIWDAHEAYFHLLDEQAVDPSKIILFHARYTLADRLAIEKMVLAAFGKGSTSKDRAGKVLIASQVVENSLDLCFDGMVSDLAPMDATIQRGGRLHRHRRDVHGNPLSAIGVADQRPSPEFLILTPDPVDEPGVQWYSDLFPKAAYVYPHIGQLWLTARLLKAKKEINMPRDLRELIEGVYGEPFEPVPDKLLAASDKAMAEAIGMAGLGQYNALNFERGYSSQSGQWSEEINVPTRLGQETHMIYLTRPVNDRLVPLKEGRFPWDLSSIRIPRNKLDGISPAIQGKYHGQIEALIESEKRLNKYTLILPVMHTAEGKWTSEGIDGKGDQVDVLYDEHMGLMVGEEIRGG